MTSAGAANLAGPSSRRRTGWLPWLVAVVFVIRLPFAWTIRVHDDERHYAYDGLWVKAELPASRIFRALLWEHVRPHVFYDPTHHEIRQHAVSSVGYPKPDDRLGTTPRAGHPPLFALLVGAVMAFVPMDWLLANDHAVHVARTVALAIDAGGALALFVLMRAALGEALAALATAAYALLPYGLLFGMLAYLDAPATAVVVASVAFYVTQVRRLPTRGRFAALGVLVGLSWLIKETSLLGLPLLVCFAAIFPCALPVARQVRAALLTFVVAVAVFASLCNPVAFVHEIRDPSTPLLGSVVGFDRVGENLRTLVHPEEHRYVHTGRLRQGDGSALDSRFLAVYDVTTPLFFVLLAIALVWLLVRGNFRSAALGALLLVFLAVTPIHGIVRRFHVVMPFGSWLMAAAVAQLRHAGPIERVWRDAAACSSSDS